MMMTGHDLVIIRVRIAEALGIQNGDEVEFLFDEIGEAFHLKVAVNDHISSDVLIHDLLSLGLVEKLQMDKMGEALTFKSGKTLHVPRQEMWAGGMKIVQKKGSAKLFFDGASKNNPTGPCGYGFHIVKGSLQVYAGTLVQGYGYGGMKKSSNEMEYQGLVEGLIWATRLHLENLFIYGDSELIINQLTDVYSIRNPRLKALYKQVHALLDRNPDLNIEFRHIAREKNQIADCLANQGISMKTTAVTCNWPNINELMAYREG